MSHKAKVRLKDIDVMLGLNGSRTLRLPPVEVMEERISNAWRRFGFTEGQISMALEYAHAGARDKLAPLPKGVQKKYYRRAFRWELRFATIWLYRLRESGVGGNSGGQVPSRDSNIPLPP